MITDKMTIKFVDGEGLTSFYIYFSSALFSNEHVK